MGSKSKLFQIGNYTILLVFLLILVSVRVFVLKMGHYAVPQSDVFQYITDSRVYASFKLPDNIYAPPGFPILIGFISRFCKFGVNFELNNAVYLNIVFSLLTLFILWNLSYKPFGFLSLLPLFFIITKSQFYLITLSASSEILFTLLTLFVIYLRHNDKYEESYIVGGLSFLVRYEALGIIIMLFLLDIFNKKLRKKLSKLFLCAFIPVFVFLLIILRQNPQSGIYGNTYIQEITSGLRNIPNFQIIARYPYLIFGKILGASDIFRIFIFIYLPLSILIFSLFQKDYLDLVLTFLVYIFIHMLFPMFEDRYIFPILVTSGIFVFGSVCYISQKYKSNFKKLMQLSMVVFIGFIIQGNIKNFYYFFDLPKDEANIEATMLADWLDGTFFGKNVVILNLFSDVAEYYSKNPKVKFYRSPEVAESDKARYLPEYIQKTCPDCDVLVVDDSYVENNLDHFPNLKRLKLLHAMNNEPKNYDLKLIKNIKQNNHWVNIYRFDPNP